MLRNIRSAVGGVHASRIKGAGIHLAPPVVKPRKMVGSGVPATRRRTTAAQTWSLDLQCVYPAATQPLDYLRRPNRSTVRSERDPNCSAIDTDPWWGGGGGGGGSRRRGHMESAEERLEVWQPQFRRNSSTPAKVIWAAAAGCFETHYDRTALPMRRAGSCAVRQGRRRARRPRRSGDPLRHMGHAIPSGSVRSYVRVTYRAASDEAAALMHREPVSVAYCGAKARYE